MSVKVMSEIWRSSDTAGTKGNNFYQIVGAWRVGLEYGSQVEAARALGWSESRLSRLINGRIEPRPEDAQLIHQKLGVDLKTEGDGRSLKKKNPRANVGSKKGNDVDSDYQSRQNGSRPNFKFTKPKVDVRLGGTRPTQEMGPGQYLVQCDSAWLDPVSKNTQEHKAVIQFRVIDSKFNGVALRLWIDKAVDAGGIISPVGKYARHCEIALGRPLEEGDPLGEPRQIFAGHRFLVLVGYRKSELPKGRGRQADDLALISKDDQDGLRVHEILSREDLQ